MKLLVLTQQCDIDALLRSPLEPGKVAGATALSRVGNDAGGDVLFAKMKQVLERKFGPTITKSMEVEFHPVPGSTLWSVTIKSVVLKEIQDVLYNGNEGMDLQLKLQLTCRVYNPYAKKTPYVGGTICVGEFEPQKREDGQVSHDCYEQKSAKLDVPPGNGNTSQRTWTLTVEIMGTDFVCVKDILPKCSDINRKIFADKEFGDFKIVSGDGTVITCHKAFLSAQSPVFSNMLKGKFKEARNNKMTIDDMTTRGINAMLEFLYCGDVSQALDHSELAFELLKTADKYDIATLWKVMAAILGKKSHVWYDVNVAFKLFIFVTNCNREESASLMKKMIQVLSLKQDQLTNSPVYQELFPVPMSQELFKVSLDAARTGSAQGDN